jgi:hypothetical protein
VYYTTIIDDPRSFTEALRATETYVKSKINKGKRDAVGAPGGKLERLEAKVRIFIASRKLRGETALR